MRIIFVILIGLSSLFSCKTGETVAENKPAGKKPKVVIPILREANFAKPENAQVDFVIVGYNIKEDLAQLTLRYKGGCKKHAFTAHFNGYYIKTLPPKATIFLKHDNQKDTCNKTMIDTIYVDLKGIRPDPKKDGSVIVGFTGTAKEIGYNYKAE